MNPLWVPAVAAAALFVTVAFYAISGHFCGARP